MKERKLTHLNAAGEAHMVGVGAKPETARCAVASARVVMRPATLELMLRGGLPKGDVFATARIAGIQAAKETARLIPLCHPLRLTKVSVEFEPRPAGAEADGVVEISARVEAFDRTGVEMEALTAASVAALTLYDMAKAVDRWMTIESVRLEHKRGGKSGDLERAGRVAQ